MSNLPPQQPYQQPAFNAPAAPAPNNSSRNVILIVLAVFAAVVLLCGGVLLALLIPAIGAAREAAERMSRSNQLKQVGLGIHNYHAAYKQLPFTVVTDVNGQELAGWRIGISPFIEGQRQWETIIQDYNPSAKSRVANDAPESLQAMDGAPGDTHMFAIVAPNSMFPPTPNQKVQFRDTLDGLANTAMVIELPNRTTNWTSNENVTPNEAYQALQVLEPNQTAHLLMGDGAVIAISPDIDRSLFDALMTRDGKEQINTMPNSP